MNVLFVSQCEKKALKKTRKVLDAFAERSGDACWQTEITADGLAAVRQALAAGATRQTSVCARIIRANGQTEIAWILGNRQKFNLSGAVPTNYTSKDILAATREGDWVYLSMLKALVGLAALWHDWGKLGKYFQAKLKSRRPLSDPVRHEYLSLLLFAAFVDGRPDDEWIEELCSLPETVDGAALVDKAAAIRYPFKDLPSLARIVGWLIVSHHRLPTPPDPATIERQGLPAAHLYNAWKAAEAPVGETDILDLLERHFGYCNDPSVSDWFAVAKHKPSVWLPTQSHDWRTGAARWAARLLASRPLWETVAGSESVRRYLFHQARTAVQMGDHLYSSRLSDPDFQSTARAVGVFANTAFDEQHKRSVNQPLDEHLCGVGKEAVSVAHKFPYLASALPSIDHLAALSADTSDARFAWQESAARLIKSVAGSRDPDRSPGFFCLNMASTGTGKTTSNSKIMYAACAQTSGLRYALALGLRSLTLQTGTEYRDRLGLDSTQMAVLVGSSAIQRLYYESQREELAESEGTGSESSAPLDPGLHIHYDGLVDMPELDAVVKTAKQKALLASPVLVCTVDHLMPAVTATRGGRHLLPWLRMMSSDLVIDEIDDFDENDLIAISRLVHLAGFHGRRVLLSSATLPPAVAEAMFATYQAGWRIHAAARGADTDIDCFWVDEFKQKHMNCSDLQAYREAHERFVERRVKRLAALELRHRCALLRVPLDALGTASHESALNLYADTIRAGIQTLHRNQAQIDPVTGKRVSFGVVRMANVAPAIDVAQRLLESPPDGLELRVLAYHSRHPLLIRHEIEKVLDRALKRKAPEEVFKHPAVRRHLDALPEHCNDLAFVVVATPVEEVGRDHDFDWAIIEPSSLRSMIQMLGRVRRHRQGAPDAVNCLLLDWNLKGLKAHLGLLRHSSRPPLAYCRPGYESDGHRLPHHHLPEILDVQRILARLDATWRIQRCAPAPTAGSAPAPDGGRRRARASRKAQSTATVDLRALEHLALDEALIVPRQAGPCGWSHGALHLTGLHQAFAPFRSGLRERDAYLHSEEGVLSILELLPRTKGRDMEKERTVGPGPNLMIQSLDPDLRSRLWIQLDYCECLHAMAETYDQSPREIARSYGGFSLPPENSGTRLTYCTDLGLKIERQLIG